MALDCEREAVEQVGALARLHVHGEAEILARLLGDLRQGGDGEAGMLEGDLADVLRPDGREAGEGTGAGGGAERGLEQAAAGESGVRHGLSCKRGASSAGQK